MEYALSNTHWLDGFTKPVERQFEILASSVEALLAKDGPGVAETPLAAVANPPARVFNRRLITGGIAAAILMLVAGLFVMFRGRFGEPKAAQRQLFHPVTAARRLRDLTRTASKAAGRSSIRGSRRVSSPPPNSMRPSRSGCFKSRIWKSRAPLTA